jgi:hypothetical protein
MGNKNGRLDHSVAEAVMLKANLKPLEPYTSAHVNWKCECLVCGSIVTPKYATVQSKGAGCKTCRYRKIREHHVLTLKDVQDVVEMRGGEVLSTEYMNVDTSMDFECSKGHKFTNRFSHIKKGQWCPTCNKGSKSEEIARTTFEQLFNYPFPKVRPKWLRNDRGYQMEIDGYCKELKIGFEYQGIQHFSKQIFGGNLDQRITDDNRKAELCKNNDVNLFILTHEMPYEDFPMEIAKQASAFGLQMPSGWEDIQVNIFEAYIREDRIEELREMLGKRLIEVLSPKYLGSQEYVELRCLKCRHIWKAKGNAFFNSRKTAGCDKCARRRAGLLNKLSLNDLKVFALQNDGEVISTEYVKRNYWYEWKCKEGHIFEGNFNNMVFRKQFCPICEGRIVRKRKAI